MSFPQGVNSFFLLPFRLCRADVLLVASDLSWPELIKMRSIKIFIFFFIFLYNFKEVRTLRGGQSVGLFGKRRHGAGAACTRSSHQVTPRHLAIIYTGSKSKLKICMIHHQVWLESCESKVKLFIMKILKYFRILFQLNFVSLNFVSSLNFFHCFRALKMEQN